MMAPPVASGLIAFNCIASLFVPITLCVAFVAPSERFDNQASSKLLRASEFRLTSRVKITEQRGSSLRIRELSIQEFYSNQQQRARIELYDSNELHQLQTAQDKLIFYYDNLGAGERLLEWTHVNATAVECHSSDAQALARALFGVSANTDQPRLMGDSWLEAGSHNVPGHIIGPSRLLFLVEQNRAALFNKQKVSQPIRNREAIRFDYSSADFNGLKMGVFYHASSELETDGTDLALNVKLQLDERTELQIDFFHAGELRHGNPVAFGSDLFAFPVGLGCSLGLSSRPAEDDWFVSEPLLVVSYQAKMIKYLQSTERRQADNLIIQERFVAYDFQARAMRVDTHHMKQQQQQEVNEYSTSIYDFRGDQIHNILFNHDGQQSIDGTEDSATSRHQCVSIPLHGNDGYTKFLDLHQLTPMGRARVRNLECMMFEQITLDLPPTLFPYLNYQNEKGLFRRAFEGPEEDVKSPLVFYNVVYYFVAHNYEPEPRLSYRDHALGPLMRVDVYWKHRLVYTLEVSNFAFQLLDAPNGDRQDELFALRDRCSIDQLNASSAAANYADASFELQYKAELAPGAAEEAAQLLSSPNQRNKAIVRGLIRANSGLSATQIYDLNSRLQLTDRLLKIHASCRFIDPNRDSLMAKVVGSADGWQSQAIHATFEDCFWRAARLKQRSPSSHVLFVACRSYCVLDGAAQLVLDGSSSSGKKSSHKYQSGVFTFLQLQQQQQPQPSSSIGCPVMSVEHETRLMPRDDPLQIWNRAYKTLLGGEIYLALADDASNGRDERLTFKVSQLEIGNEKWSSSLGYELATLDGKHSSLKNGELIDGIGLTRASGQLQRAPTFESSSDARMTYSVCRSICMASLECRSFSVCFTNQAIECITTEVNFRDEFILADLEMQKRKLNSKSGLINVSHSNSILEANGTADLMPSDAAIAKGQEDEQAAPIELRVDFRCKLYKKNALEMFRAAPSGKVKLRNSALHSVESREECAELCLKSNLAFLDTISHVKAKLIASNKLKVAAADSVADRVRDKYVAGLAHWCSSFYHLNLRTSSLLDDVRLEEHIDASKLTKSGLCSMIRPISIGPTSDGSSVDTSADDEPDRRGIPQLNFKQFKFLYSSLYEPHYGIRLSHNSSSSSTATAATSSVEVAATSAEDCARDCFLQTSKLRPRCKSFDFIDTTVLGVVGSTRQVYCLLHSFSLMDDANQAQDSRRHQQLLDGEQFSDHPLSSDSGGSGGGSEIKSSVWHYEPVGPFSLDYLAESRLSSFNDGDASQFNWKTNLIVFFVLVAAFVCSATFVELKGKAIIGRFKTSNQDRSVRFDTTTNHLSMLDGIRLDGNS